MEEKKLLNEINKNLKMMGIPIMEDINVNAQSLKSHLDNLGYDYSKSLDNAGDLDEDFTGYVKKVFKELNDKLPEYKLEITSGHSKFHEKANPSSRHNKGRAVDFIVYDSNGKKIKSSDDEILDEISEVLCDLRERIPGLTFIDEYRHKSSHATGEHFHISYSENQRDESSSTPKFCSSIGKGTKPKSIKKDKEKEEEKTDEESLLTKLLDKVGINPFKDDEDDKIVSGAKNLLGFDSVSEKNGEISILGYTLNDLKDKIKSIFNLQLEEEIKKMKKPLK